MKVALIAAPLATVLGTAASFGLQQLPASARAKMQAAVIAPLIIPKILVALAVYGSFLAVGFYGSLIGVALAHSAIALPYVVIAVSARLYNYDRSMPLAGASLGASPFSVFRKITLPLVMPGIASGAILAFVTSFDELVIALFLQTPATVTLPIKMFTSVVLEIDPTIAAASTLQVIVISVAIVTFQAVAMSRQKRTERK